MNAVEDLEPKLLRSFVVVAEELHFGRAARRLHVSQPPLSMQIRKLEEVIGARLFDRDRRHVALTETGRFLLDRARHLLGESARACAEARRIGRGESGALSIAYTATATYEVMPPVIAAFRAARPDVRLELIEMRSPLQVEALRRGRVEIGLACGPVEEEDVVSRVLVEEAVLVAVSRANPLARRRSVRLRELTPQALVLVRPDIEPAWAHVCGAALRRAGIDLPVMQETDSKIAMLGLVAANLGVSLVSASVRLLGREGVAFLPISDLKLRLPLVSLSLSSASPRAEEFLRLTRQWRSAFKQAG